MSENLVNISSFINDDVKEFSKYVLYSRAIPSVVDGLKPSQRKVLYTAIKTAKDKNIKTASLSGNVISMANYHHGDASLNDAISSMAQEFKNNLPLLKGHGSFGSRAMPFPSAARYTYVRLSKHYKEYFLDTDIAPVSTDLEDPEPNYYLPVIPWVLVNGIKGIAVGFATNIQPYNPTDLRDICKSILKGKNVDAFDPAPHYPKFNGTYEKNDRDDWECVGVYRRVGKKLTITELPVGYNREQYIKILETLIDNKSIVRYSEPKSKNKGFRFDVVLRNGKDLTEKKIQTMFKLRRSLPQNITVIDENGRLKVFEKTVDVIKHFVEFRLKQYPKRYAKLILTAEEKIRYNLEKIRFIESINDGSINMKTTLKIIRSKIKALKFSDADSTTFVKIPVYHLSADKLNELRADNKTLKLEIKEHKAVNFKDQYFKELG